VVEGCNRRVDCAGDAHHGEKHLLVGCGSVLLAASQCQPRGQRFRRPCIEGLLEARARVEELPHSTVVILPSDQLGHVSIVRKVMRVPDSGDSSGLLAAGGLHVLICTWNIERRYSWRTKKIAAGGHKVRKDAPHDAKRVLLKCPSGTSPCIRTRQLVLPSVYKIIANAQSGASTTPGERQSSLGGQASDHLFSLTRPTTQLPRQPSPRHGCCIHAHVDSC